MQVSPLTASRVYRRFPFRVGRTGSEGFALIITIVLVAFLVLILVGLATFTRVETQVADNSADIAKARQNAMESVNIALGQLQRHAGIDRATTARGDLFSNVAKEKNLTSVWSSIGGGVWAERVWLVSGSEPNNVDGNADNALGEVENPTGNADVSNIFLVGENSVENDADRILVKRQEIETEASNIPGLTGNAPTKIGHYAYWVGDEGAKASLNVIDPTRLATAQPAYGAWADDPTRARLNQQMLPQPEISNLNNNLSGIDLTDAETLAQLLKIETNNSIGFVTGFPAASRAQRIRELFHDATPRAEAVLANLTSGDGRLKDDLSDSNKGSAAVRGYVSQRPDVETDYTTTYAFSQNVYPVITEGGLRISFYVDGGQIRISYAINLELWNPYAATLRLNNNGSGSEPNPFTLEIQGLPGDIDIEELDASDVVLATTSDLDLNQVLNWTGPTDADGANVVHFVNTDGDFDWNPGAVREFVSGGSFLIDGADTLQPTISTWQKAAQATTTKLRVNYSGAAAAATVPLRFVLKGKDSGGAEITIATYEPSISFTAGDFTQDTASSSSSNFQIGYGFQVIDSIQHWTTTRDARSPSLEDAHFSSAWWTVNPESNLNDPVFNASDALRVGESPVVLYDLPRQEIVSVGQLRHVTGTGTPYQAANSLYDDTFFSTTPAAPWTSEDIAAESLPNRYLRLIKPVRLRPTVAAIDSDLRDGDRSARYLLQTGAFNINSTSVAAWRAVLGGSNIASWTHDTDGNPSTAATASVDLEHAFFRFGHGGQFLANEPLLMADIGDADDVVFTAGRQLSTIEVNTLATEIVEQIKAWVVTNNRPFTSIQDFINSGVVRAAINAVTTDDDLINDGLAADRAGTPGELTQEDVIAAMAPFITSRSDTFKIRAYGDVFNPITGTVTAQAWCEAIVQRVPDIAENLDLPVEGGPAGDNVNDPDFSKYTFGRKFIIVSFRWLSPDDI